MNAALSRLAQGFQAAGYQVYLVGGCVRDRLLGRPSTDYDLATAAPPPEIKRLLQAVPAEHVWAIGERFGTIGLKRGDRTYEITTHRAEAYTPDSRKPEVSFSTDVRADLSRRDFTVNAMALSLPEPELVDEPGARWRSRITGGAWQVNSGHLEFRAIAGRPGLKLRYLALLFAKEIVVRSTQDPRLDVPLEQLVEVATYADLKLGERRPGRRRRGAGRTDSDGES